MNYISFTKLNRDNYLIRKHIYDRNYKILNPFRVYMLLGGWPEIASPAIHIQSLRDCATNTESQIIKRWHGFRGLNSNTFNPCNPFIRDSDIEYNPWSCISYAIKNPALDFQGGIEKEELKIISPLSHYHQLFGYHTIPRRELNHINSLCITGSI